MLRTFLTSREAAYGDRRRPVHYVLLLFMSLTRQAILSAGLGRPGDAPAAVTGAAGL
jgi:hypothetical protein